MKKCCSFAVMALLSAAALSAQAPEKKDEPIVLTGCVGEGLDKGTYYVAEMMRQNLEGATIGTEPNAIFAMDSPKKLRKHVNHRVEIRGIIQENKEAKGRIASEGSALAVDAQGRKRTRIPENTSAAQAAASGGVEVPRVTYKIKVKDVVRIPNTEGCINRK